MKKIKLLLFFIIVIVVFGIEFQTLPINKAKDGDWIFYGKANMDSMARDSVAMVVSKRIQDSLSQATVIFDGDLKVKGNDIYYGNGALTANPSSGLYTINSTIVSIPSDSINAGQILRVDTTKTNVLELDGKDMIGLLSNIDNDSSVFVIKSNDSLFIRTAFDSTRDLVQLLRNINTTPILGDNKSVNLLFSYLIPNTNPYTYSGILTSAVTLANASDDNAPVFINDTYMAGNHGNDNGRLITVANGHGIDVTDVGKEYTDWSATKFYPVRIVTDSTLWMLSENSSVTDVWSFDTAIDGNLWDGADSLLVKDETDAQLKPSIKNTSKVIMLDNVTITTDGSYYGKNLRVAEYSEIADPSASLDSLIAHTGEADNTDIALGETHSVLKYTYDFGANGECLINTDFNLRKNVSNIYIGGIQCAYITQGTYDSIYVYVPNTKNYTDGTKIWQGSKLNDLSVAPTTDLPYTYSYWSQGSLCPSKFYQYLGSTQRNLDVGFVIGYNVLKNDGKNSVRKNSIYSHVLSTAKIYPYAVRLSTTSAGNSYSFQAYRQWFDPDKYDDDANSISIFEDNDNAILDIEYQGAYDEKITLPAKYSNYNIYPVNVNDSLTAYSEVLSNNELFYKTTGNASGTFLLTKTQKDPSIKSVEANYTEIENDSVYINGSFKIDGSKTLTSGYTTNTRLGIGSGGNLHAISNTCLGYTSGGNNTGQSSIHIGVRAGNASTASEKSIMIGDSTVFFNMIGDYNTVVGFKSGYGAALQNTIIGQTFYGYKSGYSIRKLGDYNAFFGFQSGYSTTTGRRNIIIGRNAGYTNTTGFYNILIGDSCVVSATADSITAIGIGNDPLFIADNTQAVATRGVTIDGTLYKKSQPFAKFKRTTNFVPPNPDIWYRVPICEVSGSHNTNHFTCSADSALLIGRAMMLHVTSAVKKYVGVNTVETAYFRLVKGVLGASSRVYSICGQHEENVAQDIGTEKTIGIPPSDMGFAQGDSLWLEMRVTDVGLILKPNTTFANPASATINLNYLFDL